MKKIIILILLSLFPITTFAQSPWLRDLTTASNTPIIAIDNASLASAIANAVPGDHIIARAGTYSGEFIINRSGTPEHLILIEAEGEALLNGGFRINGHDVFVKGFHITGGGLPINGFNLFCKDCGVINNVIHDQSDISGGQLNIGAWNTGQQIVYGNILYHPSSEVQQHNIYTQNRFSQYGYKYFVGNYIADAAPGNSFLFHAYGQGTYVSGYWLEKNVFKTGSALIGSQSDIEPDHDQVWNGNFFYDAIHRTGYQRPTHYRSEGNYLGKSQLVSMRHWGDPEVVWPELSGPIVIKNNTFAYPKNNGQQIQVTTYSYAEPCATGKAADCPRKEGVRIRSDNDVDFNTYIPFFKGFLKADAATGQGFTDLGLWRAKTSAAGKMFDEHSTVVASEPTRQFYIQNEYDTSRGFLVVYNWQNLDAITFTHAGNLAIYDVKNSFGTPIASGVDNVSIPLSGEFSTFLVKITEPEYGLEDAHNDLESCLTAAKTQANPKLKYRYLRDCDQPVSDKCEDAGLQAPHDGLESCLTEAKTKLDPTAKYRFLRNCTQIVSDECEDGMN